MSGDPLSAMAMIMQLGGGLANGLGQARAERAAAATEAENARLSLLQGELDAQGIRREERQKAGDLIAAMGASNTALGVGSNADLIAQSAYNREMDIYELRASARGQANNHYRAEADHRAAAKNAVIGTIFGTATNAIMGVRQQRRDMLSSLQTRRERAAFTGGGTALSGAY